MMIKAKVNQKNKESNKEAHTMTRARKLSEGYIKLKASSERPRLYSPHNNPQQKNFA